MADEVKETVDATEQEDTKVVTQEEVQEESKTFTKEEMDAVISKAKSEWEEQQKESKAEEERLSKLSEKEREKALEEKRLKDLEKREQKVAFKERLQDVEQVLKEKNLPVSFAKYFVSEKSEGSLDAIKNFEKIFKDEVQKGVESRIKGVSLKTGGKNIEPENLGSQMAKLRNEKEKGNTFNPWGGK